MSVRLSAALPVMLTMLEWPDDAAPENRSISARCRIGRRHSPPRQSDWLLQDSRQLLSRLHCELAPLNGAWWLMDHSKHGTFLNDEPEPIEHARQELRDGDRIRLGAYVLEVREGQTPRGQSDWKQAAPDSWTPGTQGAAPRNAEGPWVDRPDNTNLPQDGGAKLPDDWWLEKDAAETPPPPAPPRPPPQAARPEPELSVVRKQPPPPSSAADALLAAFLRGAGLRGFTPDDPERTMEQVGAAMRALVAGLQQVRISRAALKREFRIAESTFQPVKLDNPLRDLLNEDEALRALLSGRFAPAEAIEDVLKRVRLHELALVAAMRDAAESLVEALNPAKVAAATPSPIAGGLLPDRRKARSWEAYEALHKQTAEALLDDFDSVFGKTFARAYEKIVQQAGGNAGKPPGPRKNGPRK